MVEFNGPLGIREIDVSQGEVVDEDGDGRDDRVLERIEVIGQGGEALNVINLARAAPVAQRRRGVFRRPGASRAFPPADQRDLQGGGD